MNMITILSFIVYGYFMYKLGSYTGRSEKVIDSVVARSYFPVGIVEKIDGQYYLFEKDTENFMCQANTLAEIPLKLLEHKKISLAAIMCPEESNGQIYWCINGKLKLLNQ